MVFIKNNIILPHERYDMDINNEILNRIAEALERISPNINEKIDLSKSDGFVYDDSLKNLKPVKKISRVPIQLLKGLENQKDILLKNTQNTKIHKKYKIQYYLPPDGDRKTTECNHRPAASLPQPGGGS